MPLQEKNYWLKLRSRTIDFELVCRGVQIARAPAVQYTSYLGYMLAANELYTVPILHVITIIFTSTDTVWTAE